MKKLLYFNIFATILLGVVIVGVLYLRAQESGEPCPSGETPQCPFPDPGYSVFFPHPEDCHWFFHCQNGVAYCHECPGDLLWNTEIDACDYAYRVDCFDKNKDKNLTPRCLCETRWDCPPHDNSPDNPNPDLWSCASIECNIKYSKCGFWGESPCTTGLCKHPLVGYWLEPMF